MKKNILKGHLTAGGAYLIFGLNIVFSKDIAICGLITPITLFTLRAAGASILFWGFSMFSPKETIARNDLWKIVLASLLGLFIPQLTFLSACTMTTAIDISILSTLSPIFTMFLAAIVLKEPISYLKAGGVTMSFAGVLFLIFNSSTGGNGITSSSPAGVLLMLLNCLSFASYLSVFKPLIARYSVVTFMKWMFLAALLMSLPFSIHDITATKFAAIPRNVRYEIAFIIFFATFVAYYLIPISQKNIRPTLVSMYSYLQPIIAAVISIIIGMDVLTWQKMLATILVVAGVVLVNRSRSAGN